MTGYVDVREQADKDFHRALFKASLYRWKGRLHTRNSHNEYLLSFDEAQSTLVRSSQAYVGMRVVEVEKITGSVGRYKDFDPSFLPCKKNMIERWCRVDSAYHRGVELPAVTLYKVGEAYFVSDGNHRVSVARYHKAAAIDAEVIELRGHTLNAQGHEAGSLPQGPQNPTQPRASWLRNLWQHTRRSLWWPEVRPLA